MELWGALLLFIMAVFFLWRSGSQRQTSGIPGGRVIYTDTKEWGAPEKALFDPVTGITGRPDYLVREKDEVIPVEVKSGRVPDAPYDSHIYQLAAYCLMVEREYGQRPSHGIIHYDHRGQRRSFAVDYTRELEGSLLDLLQEMRNLDSKREVARSHEQPARCGGCGYAYTCDQALVS
jgi:CRISPR-associated exonuclease Cas4